MVIMVQTSNYQTWHDPKIFKSSNWHQGKEAAIRQVLYMIQSPPFYVKVFKKQIEELLTFFWALCSLNLNVL